MVYQPSELVSLEDARKLLIPRQRNGKPIAPSTIWRWIRKGLSGLDGERIHLKVTYSGSRPYITRNALDEFSQRVAAAKLARYARNASRTTDVSDDDLRAAGLL